MANVDNHVVKAVFDNAAFKKGTEGALRSLELLKAGISNISASASKLSSINIKTNANSLQPLSQGVDALVTKFSTLQVAGVTAISNISNKAVNAGLEMTKSLTIAPISGGLGEYEKKIGSIQTVLANTAAAGTTLEEVSAALTDLNHYSDQTIYNFGEMAKNIGTFTAAGVDLETATGSIKGIANLAALSGSSSEQASGAMYQLSQAISSGKVSLMDWNSVVNAGMGGSVFQRALAETAVAMGKMESSALALDGPMKNVKINGQSFRDSISAENGPSWLTSDVLTTALQNFTGDMTEAQLVAQGFSSAQAKAIMDQAAMASDAATKVKTASQLMSTLKEGAESGWAETWELIIGDFNTAPKVFTNISKTIGGIIGGAADSRNKMLAAWAEAGGRDDILRGFAWSWRALLSVVRPVIEAFRDIFPATTGQRLAELSKQFHTFAQGLVLGEENMENLRRTFRGIFAVVGIVMQVFKGVTSAIFSLFSTSQSAGGGFLAFTAIIGDFLYGLSRILTYKDPIGKFFDVLVSPLTLIKPLINLVVDLAQAISALFSGNIGFDEFFGKIRDSFGTFGDSFAAIGDKIASFFASIGSVVGGVATKAGGTFISALTKPFKPLMGLVINLGQAFSLLFRGDIGVDQFLNSIKLSFTFFGSSLDIIKDRVQEFFAGIGDAFDSFATYLQNKAKELADGGNRVGAGIVAGLGEVVQFFRDFATRVTGIVVGLVTGLSAASLNAAGFFSDIGGSGFEKFKSVLTSVVEKITEFRESLNISDNLGKVNSAAGATASGGVSALSKMMTIAGAIWSGISGMFTGLGNLIGPFLSEVGQFFTNITDKIGDYIGTMDNQELIGAINSGVLVLLYVAFKRFIGNMNGTLGSFKDMADNIGGTFGALQSSLKSLTGAVVASTVLQIAIAVGVLIGALFLLAKIDPGALKQALITLAALFAQMAAMMFTLSKIDTSKLGAIGLSMIAVATAILILSSALKRLGELDREVLIQGGIAVASLLAAMAGFAYLATFAPGIVGASVAMVIMAGALTLLAGVIVLYSKIPFETMIQGLAGMAAVMVVLGLSLKVFPKTAAASALGILIIANALVLLVPALALLGTLPIDNLVQGLLAIAGMMLIMAVASKAMTGSILGAAALMIMAQALMVLVPVLALLGALPLDVLGKGLLGIAAIMAIFVVGMYALTPVIVVLGLFATSLLIVGGAIVLAATGFYIFVKALAGLLLIGAAGFAVITAGVASLLALLPLLAQQAGYAFVTFVKVIRDSAPKLIEAAGHIIETFAAEIARRVPAIAGHGLDMIIGILKAIRSRIGEITNVVIDIVVNFITAIRERLPTIIQAGIDFIVSFMDGLAAAVRGDRERIGESGHDLALALIEGLASGLSSLWGTVQKAIGDLGRGIVKRFKEFFGINSPSTLFAGLGKNIVQGLANGIKGAVHLAKEAALKLAEKLPGWVQKVLGIKSPSTVFAEIGMYSVKGLAQGLDKNANMVEGSATNVGNAATRAMKESLMSLANINADTMNVNPTITPVLDLTDVKKGSAAIDGMMGTGSMRVNATATVTKATDVSDDYNRTRASVANVSMQERNDLRALVATLSSKVSKRDIDPVPPRPVEFHIGTVQDGDSLLQRARATNRMLSLAEGGDSAQLESI